ncbi:MAG: F0F1 ATP synthase subunit B [Coriobacteriales bacterium]|jgi:F-type H+-transporting ATPase subunit b|nr:F0F1 ATP synthase subunit B [Coriobacteriales bacterium]
MKRSIRTIAGAVGASAFGLAFAPVLAFASEEGAEEGFDGIGLLLPKLTEFIPMLIGFLVLWFVLAKFAWPPFIGMIDKRATTIRESLERAETAKVESERILEENRLQLEETRKQAAQIIADARVTGEAVRAEVIAQAQEDARLLVEKARAAIETEKKTAIAQLQSSVADLSVSVVGKVIGQDFTDADHRRLIERYLVEAGNLDAN